MNEAEPPVTVCPQCDAEVAPDSVFCPKCGARLHADDSGSEPTVPPEAIGPKATPKERFMATAASTQVDSDEEEDELWEGSYASQAMVGTWLGGGLTTAALLAIAIFSGFWLWLIAGITVLWIVLTCLYLYRRHSICYRLTSHRLLYDKGILSRSRERLELIDVDDVSVLQGPIERIVGVGRIVIHSKDVTDEKLILQGIANARTVADTIDDARRKERRRRSLHFQEV